MKLIAKYNFINVFFGSILLISGGVIFYTLFVRTMNEEVNEKLENNKDRIVALVEEGKPVESISPVMEIEKLSTNSTQAVFIHDTILFDPITEENELFREVTSFEEIDGSYYRITTRQVILERHDYMEQVGSGFLIIWLIINTGLLSLALIASRRLWGPFQKNLALLKKFKVSDPLPISFQKSSTREFNELTHVMEDLTEKVRSDYRSLREFSENAAHEIQTPLTIIQAKLENALQFPDIDPAMGKKIQAALASSHRLSKLIQTLLLIGKIENNQFNRKEKVEMHTCIQSILVELEDFIAAQQLSVNSQLEQVTVIMDPLLAEVLVTNLLTNAIKHNIKEGKIFVELTKTRLKISNPSSNVIAHPETMFNRFTKASQASTSHGLGLAIVKRICDQHHWKISYQVIDNTHIIEIVF